MQIQITTDYACRILGYMAEQDAYKGEKLVKAKDMAEILGITYQYAMKVINKLRGAEIIDSVQGCNGGYFLTDKAYTMTLYDIVSLMEGDIKISRCLEDDHYCTAKRDGECGLQESLKTIEAKLAEELKQINIIDQWTTKR